MCRTVLLHLGLIIIICHLDHVDVHKVFFVLTIECHVETNRALITLNTLINTYNALLCEHGW